ncbi:Glycerol-3-phosphate dehydrogenase [NAD(+)], cytoplasmic [Acipenser ruthenus]|uniref:glycerol-3-phosphate dehydrogenase (NAD(+)) n=1 Tax=Acipenser ruthenus TaxID=7906 RepID=A0A444V626_ACIRT|nr:Glycerol-3-phosphate dehydrogenase [NAD(+)], cytoplasmic [Acipenser ruthenus]
MAAPKKVCIVGSGNWGSAIAKIVGVNAAALDKFDKTVRMWVFEEMVNGRKLTEIINTDHENVKYLPGHKLPPNVVAVPDVVDAAKDADILVFVIPHQFIGRLCDTLKDSVKKDAIGISLIKGVDEGPEGLKLISAIIREKLGIAVSVLMGANIANEVAEEKFCETTIGEEGQGAGGGSAIAKIVGVNAAALDKFDKTVRMWVFEEMVNGRKLTEIINTDHENVKYLPGHKLPPNVVSRDPHKLNASPCKALVSAASFVCTLV